MYVYKGPTLLGDLIYSTIFVGSIVFTGWLEVVL